MRVLAIDPGQHTHGVVLADCSGDLPVPEVVCDAASTERVRVLIGMADRVVIERVELYGNGGRHLRDTIEHVGRFQECARERGIAAVLIPRRAVLKAIGIKSGRGADSRVGLYVRQRFGVAKDDQRRRSKWPDALQGTTSHAWQAWGLLFAWLNINKRKP